MIEYKVISNILTEQNKELIKFAYDNQKLFSRDSCFLLSKIEKEAKNGEPINLDILETLHMEFQNKLQEAMESDYISPKLLLQEFKKEKARTLARELKTTNTKDEFLDKVDKIKSVFAETSLRDKINLRVLTDKFFKNIDNLDKMTFLKTKEWDSFNKVVKPTPGDMTIISGRPGSGKTAFALSLALQYAKMNKKGIFFSLEMGEEQIINRIMAQTSRVPLSAFQDKKMYMNLPEEAEKDIFVATEELYKLGDNLNIVSGNFSTDDILEEVKNSKPDYIVIDYLQLLSSSFNLSNRYSEVTQISIEIKKIAMKFKIPIIALCQLSRKVEERADRHPMLSDLRDSGQIEQDASIVLTVYREAYYKPDCEDSKLLEIDVVKNRNGSNNKIEFNFIGFNQFIGERKN